jgi:hypothetical protein
MIFTLITAIALILLIYFFKGSKQANFIRNNKQIQLLLLVFILIMIVFYLYNFDNNLPNLFLKLIPLFVLLIFGSITYYKKYLKH